MLSVAVGGDAMVATMFDVGQLAPERVRPLRRSEYEQLIRAGAFGDERVELLRGVLVEMSPQNEPHVGSVSWIVRLLTLALGDRALVRPQSSLAMSDDSMPEPDVAVVPMAPVGVPPSQVFLVVEVADSSLQKDRRVKAPIYAEAIVPEYWIVDIQGRAVEVYRDPSEGLYRSMDRVTDDGILRPLAFPDVAIAVADIVPQR